MMRCLSNHEVALFLRLRGNTYSEIAHVLGVSRQYVQQITSPPAEVQAVIRARGSCESCGVVAPSGHIHHHSVQIAPEEYNAEANLALLCHPCHRQAHADPILQEKRRRRTPEELAEAHRLRGYRLGSTRTGIPFEEYRAHRENGERWCPKPHNAWVPEADFARNRSTRSGLGGRCAECNRRRTREYARRRAQTEAA